MSNAFEHIGRDRRGHFRLNFYAAIYALVHYVRHIEDDDGTRLNQTLAAYPFLARYFEEMLRSMPPEVTWAEGVAWWSAEMAAWERDVPGHLPLLAVSRGEPAARVDRLALMLVGLIEEDSRFGALFSHLQEPLPHRRPSVELVGRILASGHAAGELDAWSTCRRLLGAGLLEAVNRDAPRPEWALRVPGAVWDICRGENDPHPTPWCDYIAAEAFPHIAELICPPDMQAQLGHIPALVGSGQAQAIVLRGAQGSERLEMLGAVARALGRGVMAVQPTQGAPADEAEEARRGQLLGPLCALSHSLPIFAYDLGPGETVTLPSLPGYDGVVGVLLGSEGGVNGAAMHKALTLGVPVPRLEQRRAYWEAALGDRARDDLPIICERFHLAGGTIRRAATLALAHAGLSGGDRVTLSDVREACRALNRQALDTLAARVDVGGTWGQLVVGEATVAKLLELEYRCRHRERLLGHLSRAYDTAGSGVRALFTGASGTGKTLAAKILAAQLGMDLYRVDLGAVVNKYIGETEKNLHRVLSRAEELDVILLLDEGDALLSHRTEVKSANDRYANLETNYLLQRLESYQGIVIVTTNVGHAIDTAFQRRMDVMVNFVPPQAEERWQIWQLHLPADHAVEPAYLAMLAEQCSLTGGQIRNAALHATLLAVNDGSGIVRQWHVEAATHSEYRKAGALCPLGSRPPDRRVDDPVDALLAALE